MTNPPTTKAQARRRRYGFLQIPWRSHWCAYPIAPKSSVINVRYQCLRSPGHGPDGLYCRQHARMVDKQLNGKVTG